MVKPTNDEAQRKITCWFAPKPPKGRPKGRKATPQRRGRPKGQPQSPSPRPRQAAAPPAPKKPKATRTNWSAGENLQTLTAAVAGWDALPKGATRDMSQYAAEKHIPYETFKKYACDDKSKRRTLGKGVGRERLVSKETSSFLADVIVRHDRGNDGKSPKECVDMLQDLEPKLSRGQAENTFHRTIRKENKGRLSGTVKTQATTTKRSAVTVHQQHRWHMNVEGVLGVLREKNTGVCQSTKKSFGEVAHQYVTGGDETCLQACDGQVRIIGDKEKRKHEKRLADSRCSITAYRVGSVEGNGPTAFLMAGKRKKSGFTDEYLIKHGASTGSTIAMTETGFMTTEAWLEITPSMIKGVRAMPGICDNPQWWCIKIVDGFAAHFASPSRCPRLLWRVLDGGDAVEARRPSRRHHITGPEVLELYHDAKILLVKEEGDASHVNQAYDKFVAKEDKKSGRALLDLLRRTPVVKGVVDQWNLLCVGLGMVRACTPQTWQASFRAVNLDLRHRTGFGEWVQRIAKHLEAGDTFKPEEALDPYDALHPLWHGMTPEEKKMCFEIYSGAGGFTVQCVKDLHSKAHIPYGEMQNIRLGLQLAAAHPEHLDRGVPTLAAAPAEETNHEIRAALEAKRPVVHGLESFQLKPKDAEGKLLYAGEDLLGHMGTYLRRHGDPKATLEPSPYLDVALSDTQRALFNPTAADLTARELMKDAGGAGAQLKLSKRKLDLFGDFKAFSGLANAPERVKRLKEAAALAASVAEIKRVDAAEQTQKNQAATDELRDIAAGAAKKFIEKSHDAAKLTINELRALLLVCYQEKVPKTIKKSKAIDTFAALYAKNQGAVATLATLAAPSPATPAPSPAAEEGNGAEGVAREEAGG